MDAPSASQPSHSNVAPGSAPVKSETEQTVKRHKSEAAPFTPHPAPPAPAVSSAASSYRPHERSALEQVKASLAALFEIRDDMLRERVFTEMELQREKKRQRNMLDELLRIETKKAAHSMAQSHNETQEPKQADVQHGTALVQAAQ